MTARDSMVSATTRSVLSRLRVSLPLGLVAAVGCPLDNPTEPLAPEDVVTVELARDSILADGSDRVSMAVTLGRFAEGEKTVTLLTTGGLLMTTGGSAAKSVSKSTAGRRLLATLISDVATVGVHAVSASVDGVESIDSVTFHRARPDFISLSVADRTTSEQGDLELSIEARLTRTGGDPTDGAIVRFRLEPAVPGVSIDPIAESSGGKAVATLSASGGNAGTELAVVAQLEGENGETVSATLTLSL